jgi:hypothetical protein
MSLLSFWHLKISRLCQCDNDFCPNPSPSSFTPFSFPSRRKNTLFFRKIQINVSEFSSPPVGIPSASCVTLQNYGNKIINSFKLKPPFLFPPRGKWFFAPSPLGEGWEGGSLIKKITLKAQIRNSLNCYMNSEEIHSWRRVNLFPSLTASWRGRGKRWKSIN